MMKFFFIYISLFFLFLSCNSDLKSASDESNIPLILVDNVNKAESSLIETIDYVPLETKKDFLISSITKIIFKNGNFYILDRRLNTVFVFNKHGKFLYKVIHLGRGPGEYLQLHDFTVNNEGDIIICDTYSKKIIIYSEKGTKYKVFALDFNFLEFGFLKDNRLVLYNIYKTGEITDIIGTYNLDTKKLETDLPARKNYDYISLPLFSYKRLYLSGNSYYFNPRFTDLIYSVNEIGIRPSYHIKTNFLPTPEFLKSNYKNPNAFYGEIGFIKDIISIYETNDFLTFTIVKDLDRNILLFNKKKNKSIILGDTDKISFQSGGIAGVTADNKLISLINPVNFLSKTYQNHNNYKELDISIKNKLVAIRESDNPIVALILMKEF